MGPPLVHVGLLDVGLVDFFSRGSYNLPIVGRRQWLFCWKVCPKVYCTWLLRMLYQASYLASKLVVTAEIRWEYCFIVLTSFFSVLARLVLFVIATCILTLTYFRGLLKKIMLLRAALLTLLEVGSSKRASEETVLGESFPRYVIDRHQNVFADNFCLWLWFWFSYRYLEHQRAKLCPPILLSKRLCEEIVLAIVG